MVARDRTKRSEARLRTKVQTSDIVIVVTVVCGLVMVIGGMVLLYTGAVTLKDSNPDEAIKVEFKHMINVTTRYPALGLFVIGLAFTVVALSFVRPYVRPYPKFGISGTLKHVDDPANASVAILFKLDSFNPDPDGKFHGMVDSGLEHIVCEVSRPGENRHTWDREKGDIKGGLLELTDLDLGGPDKQEKLTPNKANIDNVPGLPPPQGGR